MIISKVKFSIYIPVAPVGAVSIVIEISTGDVDVCKLTKLIFLRIAE